MKRILLVIAIFSFYQLNAQQTTALIKLAPAKPTESKYIEPDMKTFNLYNPYENVDSAIKAAEKIAAKEGKHIFLQMGGNWCIWCARFNAFTTSDKKIDSIIKASYVVVHVNYSKELRRLGVLMCINGTGILNRWLRDNFFPTHSYTDLNNYANQSEIGSKGLMCFPYGNGAERIFNNKIIGGSFRNLDFNRHQKNEISRSVQEGIAFSMVYGLELLNSSGIEPQKIKAGYSNMYLSSIFSSTIVNASNVSIQLLESDGAYGAALGAGIGSKLYATVQEGINSIKVLSEVLPDQNKNKTLDYYEKWKQELSNML
jgi:hypothetical protein